MPKNSPARIRANMKYDKANTRQYTLKFNKNTDSDILEHLENVTNITGYFKDLVREDIKRNKK